MTAITASSKPKSPLITLAVIGTKVIGALAKVGKSLKFILAAGTFGAYSFLFTWKFALLVMIGIGLHEMGHVWAMRRCGIPTKGFYFIPLIGGAAVADEAFRSGKEEIFVALMGPVVGLLTAVVPLIAFLFTGSPFWAAASSWLAVVNLFNLFPINPLDGGRVVKGIAFSLDSKLGIIMLTLGFSLAAVLAIIADLSLLWFILFVGMLEIRPFAVWGVFFPTWFVFGLLATPVLLWRDTQSVKGYWKGGFKVLRELDSDKKPVISGMEKMSDGHWDLVTKDKVKYVACYIVLIVVFLAIIMNLAHIPGADIGEQFLKS